MSDFYVKKDFAAGLSTSVSASAGTDIPNLSQTQTLVAAATNHFEAARLEADSNVDVVTGGLLVIDGVQTVADDRVLLTSQTDPIDNGVYIVAAGSWSRASDMGTGEVMLSGSNIFIEEGTSHGGHRQTLQADATVDTDAQTWVHTASYDVDASTINSDATGRTYATSGNVEGDIDAIDAELVSQDSRLDTLEADKYEATGQTIAANTWTTFTHSLGVNYPSGIEIYNLDGGRVTDAFNIDLIDANSLRVQNETATIHTDMIIVVRK